MDDSLSSPESQKRARVIRIVQTSGFVIAGAYLLLSWLRLGSLGAMVLIPGIAALLALLAAGLVTARARLGYWLFLAAAAVTLLDLVVGYVHALFFLGSFIILGALSAINEPDDEEALTIKRIMDNDS